MESPNQTQQNMINGDLLVLQQGYSYYGCRYIYLLSQHMVPLLELPCERGRYPSVREKVVSSAMRFFHYATRDTSHPSSSSNIIIKSLANSIDLRCIAFLCLAIAIDANRHRNDKVEALLDNQFTFKEVVEKMWRKVIPMDNNPPRPPDTFYWRHITIKIPEQRQILEHAGVHLDWALSEAFFVQAGIKNDDERDIDRIRSIAIAFINDWYFSPSSGDPSRFDPKQTAVCAIYTARICLGGKMKICPPLLQSWNVTQADLSDWANQIFQFYQVNWNIVTGKDVRRNPGWISIKTNEGTKHGLQVWDALDLKST